MQGNTRILFIIPYACKIFFYTKISADRNQYPHIFNGLYHSTILRCNNFNKNIILSVWTMQCIVIQPFCFSMFSQKTIIYNLLQVYIRSSDVERCLQSAETQLAGFYPPKGYQVNFSFALGLCLRYLDNLLILLLIMFC